MVLKKAIPAFVAIGCLMGAGQAATVFSDDFSVPGTSNKNWGPYDAKKTTRIYPTGTMEVTNADDATVGLVVHELAAPKPTTFTLSFDMSSTAEAAGLAFCMSLSGGLKCYTLQVTGSQVFSYRYPAAQAQPRMVKETASIRLGTWNNYKVSKSGSIFRFYVNDRFVGSFEDATYSSGDIALLIPEKSKAEFDNVVITDQATTTGPISTLVDKFDDGRLDGWLALGGDAQVGEADGVLNVKTVHGDLYRYMDIALADFNVRAAVSHRAGAQDSLYGIFLMGDAPSGQNLPMCTFGINAGRQYQIWFSGIPGTQATGMSGSKPSTICGAAFVNGTATEYCWDTLQILKSPSGTYNFIVNRDTISNTVEKIGFDVTAAGVFVMSNMTIQFDFFSAECLGSTCTPVYQSRLARKPLTPLRAAGSFAVFSPLGRSLAVAGGTADIRRCSSLATGAYIVAIDARNGLTARSLVIGR